MAINDQTLRDWRWMRQGLDGSLRGATSARVLERTGWSRSVGGAGPYLTLFSRAGLARKAVDSDVAALGICELPSARGCTYVVPAADFGLALRAGQGHSDAATMAMAKKYLGVTDQEIDRLCRAVTDALVRAKLEPAELKEAVGGAVRNLGAEGKKRGTTTTLPIALGRLQTEGAIRRVPVNGRLDQQRYAYQLWKPAPRCALSDEEVAVELARRFFRWAGPATAAQLAWWAGLGKKAAQTAMSGLALAPIADGDERVMLEEDLASLRELRPGRTPAYALVGLLDNIAHLTRDAAALLDPADARRKLPVEKGSKAGSLLADLPHHAILDRGRLIGFWAFDPGPGNIVWATFERRPKELAPVVSRMEAFVRDQLGDARSFSLDTPESRRGELAALAKLAGSAV